MRDNIFLKSGLLAAALAIAGLGANPTAAQADGGAAHDLAQKFSDEADKPAKEAARRDRERAAESQRRSEEAEMLARARTEAEQRARDVAIEREARLAAERQADEKKRIAEEQQQAEDRRRAEAAAFAAFAEAQRVVQEERRRAEAAAQLAAEQRKAEDARREASADAAEAARKVEMAAERERETARLAEALRQAHEARAARSTPDRQPPSLVRSAPIDERPLDDRSALGAPPPVMPGAAQVTVLLLMEPGDRGIRRHNKSADPLLCDDRGCYVSSGADAPAAYLPRRRALGIGATLGPRAGACQNSLGCIFRGVDLGSLPATLQPVDMRVVRHDYREPQSVSADGTCRIAARRLQCSATLRGSNYTMWIVPETVAAAAGPDALVEALADGLPDLGHAALDRRTLR